MLKAFSLAAVLALGACTSPAPTPVPVDDLEAAELVVERFVAPSAAMVAAARAGDAEAMTVAAALTGCPVANTCPAEFGSCSSWSAFTECGATCNSAPICSCPIKPEHPDEPWEPCEPDPSIKRAVITKSAYRVCFNAAQQACTEWKRSLSSYCGC